MIFSGRRGRRALAAAAILALASAGPVAGSDGEPVASEKTSTGLALEEIGAKTLDVLLLRPLGAAATVGGVAFFIASVPLVAAAGRIGTSWDILVGAPADYTFVRPLGDF